jgi:hypothetical protein
MVEEGHKLRRLARFLGLLSLVLAFSLFIGGFNPASASSLLFDRGLPTSNLNDDAGVNRSNVAWADGPYPTANPTSYNVPGDDFIIGSPGSTHQLDKITVWTVDDSPTEYRLLGGPAGGEISQVSISASVTPVTYVGGASYQGLNTTFCQIYQVDFTVDWTVAGGELYQFFIDAPLHNYGTETDPYYTTPYLHASNAALSGSTQQGADDLFLWLTLGGTEDGSVEYWDSSNFEGWDKSSDANIRIYGTPLPSTLLLLSTGLAGLGLVRARRRFKP